MKRELIGVVRYLFMMLVGAFGYLAICYVTREAYDGNRARAMSLGTAIVGLYVRMEQSKMTTPDPTPTAEGETPQPPRTSEDAS